jgi:hypothetical protein
MSAPGAQTVASPWAAHRRRASTLRERHEHAAEVEFALTLIPAGTLGQVFGFPWVLLWLVALAGLVPGLGALATVRLAATGTGAMAVPVATRTAVAAPGLVLLGVLALRAVIIFSIQ